MRRISLVIVMLLLLFCSACQSLVENKEEITSTTTPMVSATTEITSTEVLKEKEELFMLTKEVLATKPLAQGEYFIFVNAQNTETEYYYGDMTVYNSNWEEIANFYDVTLNDGVLGIYKNRYLPVGQIRQNTEGEQEVQYGIFDLETKRYSVYPMYKNLVILDLEKGYYAVPQNDDEENWMNYQIVGGTGTILLPQVLYEDWLMISNFGNGYLECRYDYDNWKNGWTYRYYDENLQLKKVYCQSAHSIPDDDKGMEGVEYYLVEQGCLVDENGEMLIIEGLFLERYGDGVDTDCKLSFQSVVMEGEGSLYPILYQNMLYLVDKNLDLVKIIPYSEGALEGQYFKDFRYYYDVVEQEYVYQTYNGTPVMMWDGSFPDGIEICWEKDEYLLYRREGTQLFVEEYTQQERNFYTYSLKAEDTVISVSYHNTYKISVSEDSGKTIQNPYSDTYQELPIWEMSLYYQDALVTKQYGLYEYIRQLEDGYYLWIVTTGDTITYESESLYEESVSSFSYNNYVLMKKDVLLYEAEDAYMLLYGLDAIQFVKGSHIYSVGWDGTPYIRALHNVMLQD